MRRSHRPRPSSSTSSWTADRDDKRGIQFGTVAESAKKALSAFGEAQPSKQGIDRRVTKAIRELGDKRAAVRARAASALVSLSSDAVDIRTSLPALAKALTDSAASVRRPAALAAYYAIDMQGGIRELAVLDEPLAVAASDSDAQVRDRAQMALEAAASAKRRR